MVLLFAITLFLSATLLFLIQPMIAKMVLPSLGGTPAVWNTCMVFFQAGLLAGYAYSHASTGWLTTRRQVLVHVVLLFLPFAVFPISVAHGWGPPGDANPIPWLLALLLVSAGLPFFVLSTSAPLLQNWFARTSHSSAKDPYFLYAASNLGSMLALIGYPAIVEPNLTLNPHQWLSQSWLWTAGYGLFVMFMLACAWAVWRSPDPEKPIGKAADRQKTEGQANESVSAWQRLRWVALAFVPSSMMLGATTHITLDIAAIPLLWVIPLALYLLSFILVFAKWPAILHRILVVILPLVLLVLVFRMLYTVTKWPISATIGLHLLTLFMVALVCHGELARTRPSPRYLTQFYLLMSLGGVLGGLFNALVAPLIFNSVAEYNVALVLACLLLPAETEPKVWLARFFPDRLAKSVGLLTDICLAAGLGVVAYALFRCLLTSPDEDSWRAALRDGITPAIYWIKDHMHLDLFRMDKALILGLVTLLCYSFVMRPIRFGLAVGAFMLANAYYNVPDPGQSQVLYQKRSFFGVLKVQYYPGEEAYTLTHGTTLHGEEIRNPNGRSEPLTYYHTSGPIGQVFTEFSGPRAKPNVALIGLGTGTLASYGEPGQHLTIYDIDPVVRDIATNPNYFTYLRDCQADWQIILGDARLRLQEAEDKKYGIIVVDAFSSDAIPIHLITREALELYFRKLSEDGILAVHISNRHLDLQPVLGNLARVLGLVALREYDSDAERRPVPGISVSDWVILARRREDFGKLAEDERWKPIETDPKVGVWTDDYSNLLSVFMWK
ncbi:MAG TPA: fused MFS/spermidine synthase [Gemmataceae bacterium]|nr:fused MFS/spermidine synthase [Gemmataceae bacterium]